MLRLKHKKFKKRTSFWISRKAKAFDHPKFRNFILMKLLGSKKEERGEKLDYIIWMEHKDINKIQTLINLSVLSS